MKRKMGSGVGVGEGACAHPQAVTAAHPSRATPPFLYFISRTRPFMHTHTLIRESRGAHPLVPYVTSSF